MQAGLGTIACKFGGDPAICLREEAIFVKSQQCPYCVTFDHEHIWMQACLGTVLCKFGREPAICLVEEEEEEEEFI